MKKPLIERIKKIRAIERKKGAMKANICIACNDRSKDCLCGGKGLYGLAIALMAKLSER